MSLLRVENLSIRFGGIKAVDDVGFEVNEGEVFTIIGPNGAGKTTIFNLLSRIYPPSGGRMLYRDTELTRVLALSIGSPAVGIRATRTVSSCRARVTTWSACRPHGARTRPDSRDAPRASSREMTVRPSGTASPARDSSQPVRKADSATGTAAA